MSKFTIKYYFEANARSGYPADDYTLYYPDSLHFKNKMKKMNFETEESRNSVKALVQLTCYHSPIPIVNITVFEDQQLFVVNSQNITVDKIT